MRGHGEVSRSARAKEVYVAAFVLRLALGIGLLSAVADRFGLWGPPGKPTVAWGTFSAFLAYTGQLNPWVPSPLLPTLGWAVTVAETILGIALLVGYRLRITAILAAALTTVFGVAMSITLGVHAPLNYSVFPFAAGAYLLACVANNERAKEQEPLASARC
jgi:putative oxidoreductase